MRVSRPMCCRPPVTTSVEATNPSGTLPASSVVWYQNETDKGHR